MMLFLCFMITANPGSIHTTEADSSLVAFTIDTSVDYDTVTYDSEDFIRFTRIPVTTRTGWPEVPMITCMVAIPDSVDPVTSWALHGEKEFDVDPIYPAPKDSVIYVRTPEVIEVFKQDSTAYASDTWWPAEQVDIVGDMRICDQRLLLLQIYPVSFLASEDRMRVISGFSIAVSFDSTEAVWSDVGLGSFQRLIENSPIVGYHSVPKTYAPVPTVFKNFDLVDGPLRVPDYVILTADSLETDWIDSLAWHRVEMNQFDVAIVTTEEVMDEFGGQALVITDEIIRDFTEAMWAWGDGSIKPSYLLLVGDHEDDEFGDQGWFLPTHEHGVTFQGNDEWYVYFDSFPIPDNDFPDMMVGRLSVKGADTLDLMIENFIEMEQPITSTPLIDNRRRIVRLAGTGDEDRITHIQYYENWEPSREWTLNFCDWLDYDYSTTYCGDGRDWTFQDSSYLSSYDWVNYSNDEFSDGAGVLFYSNHGDLHMFGAGLEWDSTYCADYKGANDSTFNCLMARDLDPTENHQPPFVLMLCCSAGTFNHTFYEHENRLQWPMLCFQDRPDTPIYDFTTDCAAEAVLKNTDCPVSGVFCGSLTSPPPCYQLYGEGIIESIYRFGQSRLGESIAGARLRFAEFFIGYNFLGQFNLLGDPALDIGDRARYPDQCDLVIAPGDIYASNYPRETATGFEEDVSVTVRNNGGSSSGEFTVRLTVSQGMNQTIVNYPCDGLLPGEEQSYDLDWYAAWFTPPGEITIAAVADPAEECDDSWTPNNSARINQTLFDIYPLDEGWPICLVGIVDQPPLLVNLDVEANLEVVTLSGTFLEAHEHDGEFIWRNETCPLDYSISPLAADLDDDGTVEIIAMSSDGICVFNNLGECIYEEDQLYINAPSVADMHQRTGLEMVVASRDTLFLYSWDSVEEEFDSLDAKIFTFDEQPFSQALVCSDLTGDGYCETVYYCSWMDITVPPDSSFYSLVVYNWQGSSTLSERTWKIDPDILLLISVPCAGMLADTAEIGFPLYSYDYQRTDPAELIDPLSSITSPVSCERGSASSDGVIFGLFADWKTATTGLDAFIVPAENQCLAWDEDGDRFSNYWPVNYSGGTYSVDGISPPALGNLDNEGFDDILSSTMKDDNGMVLGLDSDGAPISSGDFPFTLPENVNACSGFSIADIDRDGQVEIVFGTSDGLLHVWEFGSCSTGYAPWPQHRHDSGRSGVLD